MLYGYQFSVKEVTCNNLPKLGDYQERAIVTKGLLTNC